MDTAPSSSKEGSNSRAQSPVDRNLSVKERGPGAGKISSSYDLMPEQGTARGVQQTQTSGKVDRLSRLEAIQKSLMESVDDSDSPSPLIQVFYL